MTGKPSTCPPSVSIIAQTTGWFSTLDHPLIDTVIVRPKSQEKHFSFTSA